MCGCPVGGGSAVGVVSAVHVDEIDGCAKMTCSESCIERMMILGSAHSSLYVGVVQGLALQIRYNVVLQVVVVLQIRTGEGGTR